MQLKEYKEAQTENTKIVNEFLVNWDVNGLNRITFWEQPTKVSSDLLFSKGYDILGCCTIGAIPSIKRSGADGFVYFKNIDEPQEVETKVASIESESIGVGPKGGLFRAGTENSKSKPAGITSTLCGKFDAKMTESTWATKARYTSLICFDRDNNKVIDAWMMDPTTVSRELKKRKESKTLTLKLGCFMNSGWNVNTFVDKIGWNEWRRMQVLLKESK